MALNIRGLTNSTSTLNKKTIDFLANIGYASKSHWSKYLGGNLITDSLLGIKYIIDEESSIISNYYSLTDLEAAEYKSTYYYAFINDYALSLAYTVDPSILDFEFSGETPIENVNALLNAMIGSEEEIKFFIPVEFTEDTTNLSTKKNSSYTEYRPEVSGSTATLTYTYTAPVEGEYFFYLPSDYPREVDLKVNNKSNGTFYASETTRIISLGFFEEGETVNVAMTLKADVLYVTPEISSVYYIDKELAESALAELASEQMNISEDWKEHHITGTYVTSTDNATVMTTLPYDEGWKVLVDGIEVEYTKALNAVIAFNIEDAGEHTVEFKYAPKTFTLGLTISIMSACLFILIMVFEKPLSIVWQRASEGIDSYLSKKKSEIEDESAEPDEAETSEITDDQPTPEIPEEGSVE
jgi:uncharacterized membrane protein YfhO